MLFNTVDMKAVQSILNTDKKKDLVIRMFVSAMMQGSAITAPEMMRITHAVVSTLNHEEKTPEDLKEIARKRSAV